MNKGKKGFTLIELLVSMTLISFTSVFLLKCMVISLHHVKNSTIRFRVERELEVQKNRLSGSDFNSPELSPGRRIMTAAGIRFEVRISSTGKGLKKIILKGNMGGFQAVSIFTVSESFREEEK